jgi:hypothetical protein
MNKQQFVDQFKASYLAAWAVSNEGRFSMSRELMEDHLPLDDLNYMANTFWNKIEESEEKIKWMKTCDE